jgi:hypothetical protein
MLKPAPEAHSDHDPHAGARDGLLRDGLLHSLPPLALHRRGLLAP